ncbi:PEP-CTERM sorting domain-containing protein [bacterium]|nr:PEP-CTERM sorting domain-containing protein [bacterium]
MVAVLFTIATAPTRASAQTFTGFGGPAWEAPLNWDPAHVPREDGDFALVPGNTATISATAIQVGGVSVTGGGFLITQQDLTALGSISVQGSSSGLALGPFKKLRADTFLIANDASLNAGFDAEVHFRSSFNLHNNAFLRLNPSASLEHDDGYDGGVNLENGSTIAGAGLIYSNIAIDKTSVIRADGSEPLAISGSSGHQVINNNRMEAIQGGSLYLGTLVENVHGIIASDEYSTVYVASEIRGGQLNLQYLLDSQDNVVSQSTLGGILNGTANPVTLQGRINANGGQLVGNIVNHGTIDAPDLHFAGNTLLEGGGRISMTNGSISGIPGTIMMVTQHEHSIEGSGVITGVQLTNDATGVVDAIGTLTLNTPVSSSFDRMHNQGFLRAMQGGTLRLVGSAINTTATPTIDNVGGTLYADQFSKIKLGMALEGGTLNSYVPLGGGTFDRGVIEVTSLLDGSRDPITNLGFVNSGSGTMRLKGTIHNSGYISGDILLEGNTTLLGGGKVTHEPNNFLSIGTSNRVTSNIDLVNESTISGRGDISSSRLHLVNQLTGEIRADLPGQSLDLSLSSSAVSVNHGLMEASHGGQLSVFINGGSISNDGIFRASEGGTKIVNSLANLSGGTLAGGQYVVRGNGSTMMLSGDIETLQAGLELSGATSKLMNWYTNRDALTNLDAIGSDGRLILDDNRLLATRSISNSGSISIHDSSRLQVSGDFTLLDGQLAMVDRQSTLFVSNVLAMYGGEISGSGSLAAAAIDCHGVNIKPGNSPGQLSLHGDTTFDRFTNLTMQLGGLDPGLDFDVLSIFGDVDLGDASLAVYLVNGFESKIHHEDSFSIITSSGLMNGWLANIPDGFRLTTADGFGSFAIHYSDHSVILNDYVPTAIPEPSSSVLLVAGIGALAICRRCTRRRPANVH